MKKNKESQASIIAMIILLSLLALCILVSCRTLKNTKSELKYSETLAQSAERLTASQLSDFIIKNLSLQADSIILEYQDEQPYRDIPEGPEGSSDSAMVASNRWLLATKSESAGKSNALSHLKHSPRQGKANNPPSLKAIKLYAPHIAESSEESSVEVASSSDRNDQVEQSDIEEADERQSAPSPIQKYIFFVVAAAIALFIYRHSR